MRELAAAMIAGAALLAAGPGAAQLAVDLVLALAAVAVARDADLVLELGVSVRG